MATFNGTSGNDFIVGTAQFDSISGGDGNDTLIGKGGPDRIFGGNGSDELIGGAGSDTLSANGANDSLRGGAGPDDLRGGGLLDGGAGNDQVSAVPATTTDARGGSGFDILLFPNVAVDLIVDLRAATAEFDISGRFPMSGFEGVFAGFGRDRVTGTAEANLLGGGEGNDTLRGLGGNDELDGGLGNDRLVGGAGIDLASFDDDRVFVETRNAGTPGTLADLASGQATGVFGTDLLVSIEGLRGGSRDDTLRGNGAANEIHGDEGHDKLIGRGGSDALFGGLHRDTLLGGAGRDLLAGEEGSDLVKGGGGADILSGNEGRDTLIGGKGADLFGFVETSDIDIVRDFTDGEDRIFLDGRAFDTFQDVRKLARNDGPDMLLDLGAGDILRLENFQKADFDAADVLLFTG